MKPQRKQRSPRAKTTGKPAAAKRVVPARRLAFDVLSADRVRQADRESGLAVPHVTQLLDDRLRAVDMPPAERRLATELVLGIVRRRATLEAILSAFLTRSRDQIEEGLWTLLELGAYQLVLMTSIPSHAAVHETVELAVQLRKPQWRGFLNGVLREIGRSLKTEMTGTPEADRVPLIDREASAVQYRSLTHVVFADPQTDPGAYLAEAFSYPRWLVDRWLRRSGRDEAFRLAAWFDRPGAMSFRVSPLRGDREKVLEVLAGCGVEAVPGELAESVRLSRSLRVEDIPGFAEGWFSVQDESAMQASLLLDPQPGETILDLCAAPGGKTTHLAERMRNTGRVVAGDINARRLERVTAAAERLGLSIIEPLLLTDDGPLPAGPFDAALVDAPCSNTGVLGKRPDVRWRIAPADLDELPQLQAKLLRRAIAAVRPGGRIVYSTCSIEPEENEAVVQSVLADEPSVQLVEERRHLPGQPGDGGYQSLLRKL